MVSLKEAVGVLPITHTSAPSSPSCWVLLQLIGGDFLPVMAGPMVCLEDCRRSWEMHRGRGNRQEFVN